MFFVSDINSFLFCKRKFALSKVLKIKEHSYSIDVGNFFHECIEFFYKNEQDYIIKLKPTKDSLELTYRKLKNDSILHVIKKYRIGDEELTMLNQFVLMHMNNRVESVKSYLEMKGLSSLEGIEIYPKIKSEVKISDETLNLIGRVDMLEIYEDEIVPVEIKSSELRDSYTMQAVAYGIMLRNRKFHVSRVKILSPKEIKEIYINPFHVIELKKLLVEMEKALLELPKPEYKPYCESCVYKEHCF
ncbi:MAG: CRISPR-associated protein Cas4 [Candidatus Woesearchaeota archaeon]